MTPFPGQLPTANFQLPSRPLLRHRAAWKLGVGAWALAGVVAVASALLCPAGAFAQQDKDDAFKRGLEARDKKNWNAVVTAMKEAIAIDSKESPRKVGGGILRGGTEYVPHYLLGEALYNLNDCVGAVTEWGLSEQQPVVGTKSDFKGFMATGYRICAMRGVLPPAQFNPQFTAAKQAVDEGYAQADRVVKLNAEAWRPELRQQYERIREDLNGARTRLDNGTRTRSAADLEAARTTAIRATNGLRAFESALNASIENLGRVQGQARDVEQIINGAEAKDRAIDDLKTTLPQALAASRQQGRDALGRARSQLTTAERSQNIAAVSEASQSAQQAATILEQVLSEATKIAQGALEQQFTDARTAASEALSFLDSSLTTLGTLFRDQPGKVTPDVQSQRDALDKRVADIRRRVEAAQKTQSVGGLQTAVRLAAGARADLDRLVTSFGPLSLRTRGVQQALEDGARQFFAGEYQQALTSLESDSLTDAPLQLHVHLFRAAASYYLFVRSGEKDEALKKRALDEIAACKRLNSQFTPDSRAFAPRFLAFYENATPAAP